MLAAPGARLDVCLLTAVEADACAAVVLALGGEVDAVPRVALDEPPDAGERLLHDALVLMVLPEEEGQDV